MLFRLVTKHLAPVVITELAQLGPAGFGLGPLGLGTPNSVITTRASHKMGIFCWPWPMKKKRIFVFSGNKQSVHLLSTWRTFFFDTVFVGSGS